MLEIIKKNGVYKLFNPYKQKFIPGNHTTRLKAVHRKRHLETYYLNGLMFNSI